MNAWIRVLVDCCDRYFLILRILSILPQIFVICISIDSLESNQEPRCFALGMGWMFEPPIQILIIISTFLVVVVCQL